jgi:hypothetical protein
MVQTLVIKTRHFYFFVIHCLFTLAGFDLAGQSGLLVYRRRTK